MNYKINFANSLMAKKYLRSKEADLTISFWKTHCGGVKAVPLLFTLRPLAKMASHVMTRINPEDPLKVSQMI